jgi:hypothetical protein
LGINLGPVKLVQDINGQRNLIGDGINVAQRVMSFAKPGQVLVSRSYFEVISRLSQEYAKLFHYEGSRADKHVREHQVYSVSPEEKDKVSTSASPGQRREGSSKEVTGGDAAAASAADTDEGGRSTKVEAEEGRPLRPSQPSSWRLRWNKMRVNWSLKWLGWKERLNGWSAESLNGLRGLGSRSVKWMNWSEIRSHRTAFYVAAALIVLLISVPVIIWQVGRTPVKAPGEAPLPTVVATPEVAKKIEAPVKAKKTETTAETKKMETPAEAKKIDAPAPASEDQKKAETATPADKPPAPASLSFGIAPWGEVYVDGNKKGVSPPMNNLQVAPGKHQIEIRNTHFPPYKQSADLKPGEQLKIRHKFQ